MGSLNFILDTNIIICLQKGLLTEPLPHGAFAISIISEIELRGFAGLNSQQQDWLARFLATITIVDIDSVIKEETIRLRQTTRLKLPDALIVATAMTRKAVLLTNDEQLFSVPGLTCRKLEMNL
jgi:predicted nucleic acid-binding protein